MFSFVGKLTRNFYFSVIILGAIVVVIVLIDVRVNGSNLTKSVVNATYNLNEAFSGRINEYMTDGRQNSTASVRAVVTIDPLVKSVFDQQQAARQAVIAYNLVDRPPGTPELHTDLHYLYDGLVPEVLCGRLVRIGNTDDGGKWLCDPWSLPTDCVLYSLGVGGDNTFEKELGQLLKSRCATWSFDNNAQYANLFIGLNQSTFRPWRIGQTTNASSGVYATLDIMKQFNHTYIDLLKIDIESSEYDVVPDLLTNVTATNTAFCHVLIEMHGSAKKQTRLLQKFAKADYLMYSYEVNGWDHMACEYSFIHRTCMNQYGMHQVLQRNFAV